MSFRDKINLKYIVFMLGIVGPGIITAIVGNDAGGITTYSIAGAQFGYSLLWTLIPITIFLIIVQEMCSRMGAITGKGLGELIRENFGVKITIFLMIGLLFANLFVTVAEFAGIAAAAGLFGISKYVVVPLAALAVLFLTIRLDYKSLEKFFLILTVFYLSYVISGFLSKPDWGLVLHETLIPTFSFHPAYLILLVGIIGTTITPWMQFYLQSSIVEKGITEEEYKYSKWDVILGCITTDIIAFFIIVVCATVLFPQGIGIESAVDAARALQPVAGNYAAMLFAFGFFGAALFGAFILPISTSFYVCEAFGWEAGISKSFKDAKAFYLLLIAIIAIGAGVILIPRIPLIQIMLTAQVVNGVILPIVLLAILKLANDKNLMGDYVNPPWLNAVAWASSIIIIIVTILMILTTIRPGILG